MSYAIVRNEKLTRDEAKGRYVHNGRKARTIEKIYEDGIYKLEKENSYLHKIINTFEKTIHKFITWICQRFDMGAENNLVRDFEKEAGTYLDAERQLQKEKDMGMEL